MNQLDGEKADYDNVLDQMKEVFGSKVIPIQYPLSCGAGFNSMIDVLLMKKYSWGPDGGVPTIEDIPAEEMEKAKELHQQLVRFGRKDRTRSQGIAFHPAYPQSEQ